MSNKTALVLSGGGAKGAYQIGVIKQLFSNGVVPECMMGTSIGAINASAVAYNDIDKIITEWTTLKKRSDVLRINWKIFTLFADGLLSMKKLKKNYIDKYVTGVPKFEVKVCRNNLLTGASEYVSNLSCDISDFRNAVQDSATIPLFMEPRSDYMDGGLRDVIPLRKAILDGYNDIHVITCNPWTANPPPITSIKKNRKFFRFYNYLQRSIDDVMNHEVKYNDLYIPYLMTKDRTDISIKVYCPNYNISSTLEFDPTKIKAALEHGLISSPVDLKSLF